MGFYRQVKVYIFKFFLLLEMNFVLKIYMCFTIVCTDVHMPDLPIQGLKCV